MKLMIAILTHHDIPRLRRLITNMSELLPAGDIEVHPVIVVNSLNPDYYGEVLKLDQPYHVYNTPSLGNSARGKNCCHEVFLDSDCDYLCQIDGDDVLYPTTVQSFAQHLNHYPCLDVLGVIPIDRMYREPHGPGWVRPLPDGNFTGLWGISLTPPPSVHGPGRSHALNDGVQLSVDKFMLISRKAAEVKYHEDMNNYEDLLMTSQYLAMSQRGELCYFHTMSSDIYVQDRTNDDNIQLTHAAEDWIDELQKRTLDYVPEWRSSAFELPMIYKDLLMNQHEKTKWLQGFIAKTMGYFD